MADGRDLRPVVPGRRAVYLKGVSGTGSTTAAARKASTQKTEREVLRHRICEASRTRRRPVPERPIGGTGQPPGPCRQAPVPVLHRAPGEPRSGALEVGLDEPAGAPDRAQRPTSLRMCEDKNTAWPAAFASCTNRRNSHSISASRALVGSSTSSTSDRLASPATRVSFCQLPFEQLRTFLRRGRRRTARPARPGSPDRPGPAPGLAGAPSRRRPARATGGLVADAGQQAAGATTVSRWTSRPKISASPDVGRSKPQEQRDGRHLLPPYTPLG